MAINENGVQVERQYIGARYVPKFFEGVNGSPEWVAGLAYEALTIVTYLGNSFTSKVPVPAGVGNPADNPTYWVNTGNYNAQVDAYRGEVAEVKSDVAGVQGALNTEIQNRKDADELINENITSLTNVINNNSLKNKKILIVGDSLSVTSEPASWVNRAIPLLETAGAQVTVNAEGGRKLVNVGTTIYNVLSSLPTDADIVLIFLGVNDISYQAKIGGFNNTDNTTFNGAIKGVIDYFKKSPNTRIIFVTPLKCIIQSRVLETYPDAYRLALYQNCYLRGCEIIDAGGCAPCYVPQEPYTHDGVHLSSSYSPIFASYIVSELMRTSHAFYTNIAISRNYSGLLPESVTGTIRVLYYRRGGYQLFVDVTTTESETVLCTLPEFLWPTYVTQVNNITAYNTNGTVVAHSSGKHVVTLNIHPKSQLYLTTSW